MRDFIIDFDQAYLKFERVNLSKISDLMLSFDLLVACNLTDRDTQLVKATLGDDSTYKGMKSALRNVFDIEDRKNKEATKEAEIIEEPVLYTKNSAPVQIIETPALYTKNSATVPTATLSPATEADTLYATGDNRPYRGRRGRGRGGRSRGRFGYSNDRGYNRSFNRNNGLNPLGRDGKPTTCLVCKSIYHYARECSNASDRRFYNNNDSENDGNYQVKFSMFVGCTSNQENEKLKQLVNESRGYAILDSGCTNSVCGEVWMEHFVENLSDKEREMMKVEPSNIFFTFGYGGTVTPMRKVTIP